MRRPRGALEFGAVLVALDAAAYVVGKLAGHVITRIDRLVSRG